MTEDDKNPEEIEVEAIGVEVSSQPIELYKVFKIANLVGGGGEAKHLIAEGYVAVNGELETRKRRKMYDGDVFEFNQEFYVVLCNAGLVEQENGDGQTSTPDVQSQNQATLADKDKTKKENSGKKKNKLGRSDIDFF
ncbi:hypothetical protein GCM10007938_08120 [Vibrio zhanjiangensis]|uniref:Urease n=1 Tax=Vibrio zhanjiangensis TaxID=1046128 RepID=A0ABQ6EV32_9VIBR|nr:RNA-binding S4 domain-containing protein [Vibrio zhanjiangensis]GLT17035.1 hypothetical protein GCM10007938_08120 [Vibrio zhanjiangensis]